MKTSVTANRNSPAFNNFFEDLFDLPATHWLSPEFEDSHTGFFPPVNISETENNYLLEVVAPGMEKSDFKIKTEGDTLSISAEKKEEKKGKSDKDIRSEYSYRAFKRSFTLNDDIDQESLDAKYENGVLHLTLPKKEEKIIKPKEIAVK